MTLWVYIFRRSSRLGILASLALFGFHFAMAYVYRGILRGGEAIPVLLLRSIPKPVQSFLGLDRLPLDSLPGFLAAVYQHPFVMIVVCGFAVACASELLAGQVERLTITHLLVRPVARPALPLVAASVCVAWLAVVCAAALMGTVAGLTHLGFELPVWPRLVQLGLGLWALGVCAASVSIFFSATTDTRSDAAGWSVSVLLLMYVGNFIAQVWESARPWAQYSIFSYFSPIRIFTEGALPAASWQVFGLVVLAASVAAVVVYAVREFRV